MMSSRPPTKRASPWCSPERATSGTEPESGRAPHIGECGVERDAAGLGQARMRGDGTIALFEIALVVVARLDGERSFFLGQQAARDQARHRPMHARRHEG